MIKLHIRSILIAIWIYGMFSCSNNNNNKLQPNKILSDTTSTAYEDTLLVEKNSFSIENDELTKIYTQAIGEFIKAIFKKDHTTFDTLYFGKHVYGQDDDFPDIDLPETIEKTQIKVVSPEIGKKLQGERKSLVYVNMMGWVEKMKAEFLFVVFSKGAAHQYDYYITFTYSSSEQKFKLSKIEFEDFRYPNVQKTKR